MSTKISELPLTGAYTLTDYIPIVDSAGLITNRVRMSTLVTGSYGLSASFLSIDPGGSLRVNKNGSTIPLFTFDGANSQLFGDTTGAAYSTQLYASNYAYLGGASTFYIANAASPELSGYVGGVQMYTIRLDTGFTSFYPITASLGVSASIAHVGQNCATTGDALRLGGPTGNYTTIIKVRQNASDWDFLEIHNAGASYVNVGPVVGAGYQMNWRGYGMTYTAVSSHIFYDNIGTELLKITPTVINVGGNTTTAVTFVHSGSTIAAYDSYLKRTEDRATMLTTPGSPSKAMYHFISGVNDKSYLVDTIVTAQSTTTTGSLAYKLTGHYYMVGGVIGVVDAPYTILESANHSYLTASLTSSAGYIIVSGTQGASAETFRWGCFVRIQEQGAV